MGTLNAWALAVRRRAARLVAARHGTAALEFAMIWPFLVGMLVPLADLGEYAYEKMQLQAAAQAGAEYASQQGFIPAAVENAITSASSLPAAANLTVLPSPFDVAHAEFCGCASGTGFSQTWPPGQCPNPRPTCANGAIAGVYITVGASAQYTPISGLKYPFLSSQVITASSIVRVQ
jgi:TadE-like protein